MGSVSQPRNHRRLDNRSRSSRSSRTSFGFVDLQSSAEVLTVHQNLTVCQLNVEGISKDKCDFLSKMALRERVDVIVLQETHTSSELDLFARGQIPGYTLVDFINSATYGSATYVRSNFQDYQCIAKSQDNNIFILTVKIAGVFIINIYKPPNDEWPANLAFDYHPAVFIGDFNCHHNLWGYAENDRNGLALLSWMELNNLHLVFDAKDRKSFYSARWKKDYNPDLCFVTMNNEVPLETSRAVLSGFPHSQHRPVIVKLGTEIKPFPSLQKPRWNFQKARWTEFAKQVDSDLRWIPSTAMNYHRFVGVVKNAAKKFIPRGFRKNYIPCWTDETSNLYNAYVSNPNPENADAVLNAFNKARKEKWNSLMEDLNFTHSSRSSWKLLQKLGSSNIAPSKSDSVISPNAVASRLVKVSNSVKLERNAKKEMKRKVRKQRRTANISEHLSRSFNVDELKAAISSTKCKISAGFDGIYHCTCVLSNLCHIHWSYFWLSCNPNSLIL